MKTKKTNLSIVRAYVDTSVFGGVLDAEFSRASGRFLDMARAGGFAVVISPVVTDELRAAPPQVRGACDDVLASALSVAISEAALELRDAYVKAGIVSARWSADALHVALASVAGCSIIVSWNFKHIVNFRKVPLYNAINRTQGYAEIGIYTPQEVVEDE